jgi:uncharacterized iron-regulated membrane protein
MIKLLNKWLRKLHRWLAIPMIVIVPVAILIKLMGSDPSVAFPPILEQLQSILLLTLVVTGVYLYFIPYIAKWQRNQRQKSRAKVVVVAEPSQPISQLSQE